MKNYIKLFKNKVTKHKLKKILNNMEAERYFLLCEAIIEMQNGRKK